MGVSKAHAGEEEPRERLACVDGNPVDEIAVEGDLLRDNETFLTISARKDSL